MIAYIVVDSALAYQIFQLYNMDGRMEESVEEWKEKKYDSL